MEINKKWYLSKTVWAALFTAGVVIATSIMGETNQYVAMAVTIGSALGIYGRAVATSNLSK